jgi:predicted metalloprotease
VVVLGIIGWAFGIDPGVLIGGAQILSGGSHYQQQYRPSNRRTGTPPDQIGQFVAAVLGNTEDTWSDIFRAGGRQYSAPRLRLYAGAEQGGCGYAQAAMGPFYCPNDRRIYLDTSFFRQIETRFHGCQGNACKFSQAYVIAHEVGHHVQNLLGTLSKARAAQEAARDKAGANRIQVRVELQADCYAGIWANHSEQRRKFLDPGDIDAALQTASAIGDDTLQKQAQGRIVPDAFTHGSAEQRKRWFTTGFTQGKLSACDTFAANSL